MCLIPIAPYLAGRYSRNFSDTFTFGFLCATLFTSTYYSSRLELPEKLTNEIITVWLTTSLFCGTACWLISLLPGKRISTKH